MTHTPGPWKTESTHVDDPAFKIDVYAQNVPIAYKHGTRPTVCTIWQRPEVSECEANAELIAAAPELLAACVKSLAELDYGDISAAGEPLRAAIAKAKP